MMKTLIYSVLFVLITFNFIIAQPMKMHERMLTVKKIKLLEYIELDTDKSDKLLVIVNNYENKLKELNDKIRSLGKEIDNRLNKLDDKEIKKKNDELLIQIEKISELQISKLENARKILSEKEFAKFQIFELKFAHELRKHLFENRKKRKNER